MGKDFLLAAYLQKKCMLASVKNIIHFSVVPTVLVIKKKKRKPQNFNRNFNIDFSYLSLL